MYEPLDPAVVQQHCWQIIAWIGVLCVFYKLGTAPTGEQMGRRRFNSLEDL